MRSVDDHAMRRFIPIDILEDEEVDKQWIPDVQQNEEIPIQLEQMIEEEIKEERNNSTQNEPSIEEEI